MKDRVRRKIKQAILTELRCSSHPFQGTSDEQISERICDEIDVILKAEGYPHIDFSQGKRPLSPEEQQAIITTADPLGADRKAREL